MSDSSDLREQSAPAAAAQAAQRRLERATAARHSGRVEGRIVFEAVWGVGGWAALIGLAVTGSIPYWVAMLASSVLVYCLYMPLHEATHNNIQGNHWNLRWLNDWVGRICSIPVGFSFRAHQISHMRHHAFTNDPVRDPDYYTSGSMLAVPSKILRLSLGQIVIATLGWRAGFVAAMPQQEKDRLAITDDLPNEEFITQRRFATLQLALIVLASIAGYFPEVMLLYYLPSRFGIGAMMLLFAWFPHHPAKERGRYRDTRVMLFPGSRVLFRGHDSHIIHHMLPRIPHYRIPAAFAELRPSLEAQGIRIEGRSAGPGYPPVLLRTVD